ncbi:MAG: hypothetical protein A2Y14_04910 [Verrucomicrobia bacterium GWF2_51_19]|nr:MAG: hypothetical protein A2Y14_04910 [Verrucomicrobia bacterium GWF2_51_19]HCJ11951.1 peptidase M24 [Opitutae bacterium]
MKIAKLLYDTSERNSDLLYLGKFVAPDAFLAMEVGGKRIAVLSRLEYGRAKRESAFDEILSYETLKDDARARFSKDDGLVGIVRLLKERYAVTRFLISEDCPVGFFRKIETLGVEVGPLFPERQHKSEAEQNAIAKSNDIAKKGFRLVQKILKESKTRGNKLYYKGKILRSEFLRQAIEVEALQNGFSAQHTIASSGEQSADPHCVGTGPVYADALLVVDIFPRNLKTGYFGDMTRTFLPKSPSTQQLKMYKAVEEAQILAIGKLKNGVDAANIHKAIEAFFEKAGFHTTQTEGFIHSTGHGVGLDIHEHPRISKTSPDKLQAGHVITIEPGLYYQSVGGVRIEDVFAITQHGFVKLS